jgi:hypothetical protein
MPCSEPPRYLRVNNQVITLPVRLTNHPSASRLAAGRCLLGGWHDTTAAVRAAKMMLEVLMSIDR